MYTIILVHFQKILVDANLATSNHGKDFCINHPMSSINLQPKGDASFYGDHAMELKNNEIDLLHLIGILWRSKKVIGTMVLLFAVVGFFISALLPQKWTSQAEITPAENIQWSELQKTLMTLQVLDVKTEIKTEDVFHLFLKKFMSQSLKEEFLSTSPLVLGKLQEQNIDSEELRRALVLVAGKIKATNNASPAKGDETLYDSWTLAFTAPTPPEAQQVLQSYIDFIAGKVVKETLDSPIKSRIDRLRGEDST